MTRVIGRIVTKLELVLHLLRSTAATTLLPGAHHLARPKLCNGLDTSAGCCRSRP